MHGTCNYRRGRKEGIRRHTDFFLTNQIRPHSLRKFLLAEIKKLTRIKRIERIAIAIVLNEEDLPDDMQVDIKTDTVCLKRRT